jgi:hypothetical protein
MGYVVIKVTLGQVCFFESLGFLVIIIPEEKKEKEKMIENKCSKLLCKE